MTAIVESALFRNFIMTLIVINAVTLGLETYPYEGVWFTNWMPILDRIIVGVFVIEILMKLVVGKDSRKVLGCHIVGPAAGEMIQLAGIAVKMGATKEDFDRTVAVHPTAAEEIVTMRNPTRTLG